MKKARNVALLCLLAWVVFAQSCMFFRISDQDAAAMFTAKSIQAQVFYEQVGNTRMHYVKTGADSFPTLFFIHGSPGSWDAFKDYLMDSALLAKYRMVSVDRPGFGYSDFGHAVNLDEESVLLSELITRLQNGRPFYLVGHSLGGPLCVRLAIDNPRKLSGLVLLSAAIDPSLEKPEKWRKLLMNNPLEYLVPGAMRPSNYELWYLKADLKEMQTDLLTADLPFIWMIHGNQDNMVPYANVSFARKYFKAEKLDVVTIDGANHFIPWSHFGKVKQILLGLPLDSTF